MPDLERKGVFTVVVPDVEGAERVTLQSNQPATREALAKSVAPDAPRPVTTIASFKLDYKNHLGHQK